MDKRTIAVPYAGQKMIAGYLKKESANIGLMLSKFWQAKYFILDLYSFVFKYSKNPAAEFTVIPLSKVVDVVVHSSKSHEDRFRRINMNRTESKGLFGLLQSGDSQSDEHIFEVQTHERSYRLQASTKSDFCMWLRAFAVVFELRLRVLDTINSDANASARKNRVDTNEGEETKDFDKSMMSIDQGERSADAGRLPVKNNRKASKREVGLKRLKQI